MTKFKTKKIIIESFNAYYYRSLFEITEMKGSMIFKTKETNFFIKVGQPVPKGYIDCSISTRFTKLKKFEINVIVD